MREQNDYSDEFYCEREKRHASGGLWGMGVKEVIIIVPYKIPILS